MNMFLIMRSTLEIVLKIVDFYFIKIRINSLNLEFVKSIRETFSSELKYNIKK